MGEDSSQFICLLTINCKANACDVFCSSRTPEALSNTKVAQVACGSQHVVALSTGTVVSRHFSDDRKEMLPVLGAVMTTLRSIWPPS